MNAAKRSEPTWDWKTLQAWNEYLGKAAAADRASAICRAAFEKFEACWKANREVSNV